MRVTGDSAVLSADCFLTSCTLGMVQCSSCLFCQVCNCWYNISICSELPHLKEYLQVPEAKEISWVTVKDQKICILYTVLEK